MSFSRMICALIIWLGLDDCSPCCAQPSLSADVLPSTELNTQAQAAESKPDPAEQRRIRIAEARRLWAVVLVNRRAGKSQEARVSYVLYLKAAYVANANPWLLLELGRALGQRAVWVLLLLEVLTSLVGLCPPGLRHASRFLPAHVSPSEAAG